MSPAIDIANVSKSFRRHQVLSDITLSVPNGVVFALLGENGAGKSTLIRGMLGYHRFDSGVVDIMGLDPCKQPLELRRRVAYVSDAPGMYEWMTVAEAGWYASGFYPDGFLKAYAELAADFKLPASTKIRDLSKGMRAKVALALAMAFNPQLMILDEPTSGLDPHVRRAFLESMIDRAAAGQTVFLSSHQIHEVERVADWVGILHQGKLRIVEPIEVLKEQMQVLRFSLRDPLLALPTELDETEIVQQTISGRTTEMMVRSLSPQLLEELRAHPNIFEVHTVRPNLEELYLAFTQDNVNSAPNTSTRLRHTEVA